MGHQKRRAFGFSERCWNRPSLAGKSCFGIGSDPFGRCHPEEVDHYENRKVKMEDRQPGQLTSPEPPRDAPRPMRGGAFKAFVSKREKKRIRLLKKACAFLAITFIFYLLGRSLYQNFGEISRYPWEIKYEFVILSFLCLVMNLAIASYAWKKILSFFHTSLPIDQSIATFRNWA